MKRISTSRILEKADFYADLTRSNWSPIIQPSGTGDEYWNKLFQYFPEYQLFWENEEGEWLGFANTIPVLYTEDLNSLPEEGWDWLLAKGIKDHEEGNISNTLGGLQIGVNPKFRGQGLSKKILQEAKQMMKEQGLEQFILPIRPTLKDQHPAIPMEEYMNWKKDNKIYDPWIRTHINSGAAIIKVCHKAMEVAGSLQDWEQWTGKKFYESGQYPIDGGLSLVEIDFDKKCGLYLEPNIWIYYK